MLETGDIVLCTVEKITKTIVFVKIKGNGQASIIMSEIAPGRIRNIRDYVVAKKRIVCKVLRISNNQIELSLRRVTQKERKEILKQERKEKSYKAIFKKVLGESAKEIIQKIEKENNLYEFLEDAKENPKDLNKLIKKSDTEKILEILKTQKTKKAILKKEIKLTTTKPNGLTSIKKTLEKFKYAKIKYISAGRYSIEIESENIKEADKKLKEIFRILEKESKKQSMEFEIK